MRTYSVTMTITVTDDIDYIDIVDDLEDHCDDLDWENDEITVIESVEDHDE